MPTGQYAAGAPFNVEVEFETDGSRGLSCEVLIVDQVKAKIALASLSHFDGTTLPTDAGVYRLLMSFPPLHLAAGKYALDVATAIVNQSWDHYVEDAVSFEVLFSVIQPDCHGISSNRLATGPGVAVCETTNNRICP